MHRHPAIDFESKNKRAQESAAVAACLGVTYDVWDIDNSLGVERSGFRKGEVKMLYPFGSRIFLPGRKDTGKVCKVYRKSGSQFCKFVNMTMMQNCAVAGG